MHVQIGQWRQQHPLGLAQVANHAGDATVPNHDVARVGFEGYAHVSEHLFAGFPISRSAHSLPRHVIDVVNCSAASGINMELRLCKVAVAGSLALFALLCGIDNVMDYESNFMFVSHVLSMDTTFSGNSLRSRAITEPALWRLGYAVIIGAELVVGACYLGSAVQMLRRLNTSAARFNDAKRLFHVATALAFLLWFTGFMAVAGEWFQMWQSTQWNGQEPAFRFYITSLVAAIFVGRDEAG
jgi:predicted small integral membrane protein